MRLHYTRTVGWDEDKHSVDHSVALQLVAKCTTWFVFYCPMSMAYQPTASKIEQGKSAVREAEIDKG